MREMVLLFVILALMVVSAHGEDTFFQAEKIIEDKIPCDKLSEKQLEILGDYYMEQMHPGKLHERMDEMMGGEGSENLRRAHINMGKSFYCKEQEAISGEMMEPGMGMMDWYNAEHGFVNRKNMNAGFGFPFMLNSALVLVILLLAVILLIKTSRNKNGLRV